MDWVAKYVVEGFHNIKWIECVLKNSKYYVDWVAKYVVEGFHNIKWIEYV